LRGPAEPAPAIIRANSRVRSSASFALIGIPAQWHTARHSTSCAASCTTTRGLPAHCAKRVRHSAAARPTRRWRSRGPNSDISMALRFLCASPSSAITLPKSCSRASVVAGSAWRRVKRPG
jgi:hypothetical protein